MSLIEQLKKDNLEARKQKNTVKSNLLSTLVSEAVMIGKNDGNREPTEAEITAVIKKFVKNGRETLKALEKGDRDTGEARQELEILESYLPEQLSEEKLSEIIDGIIADLPEKNMKMMGKVMGALKDGHDGSFDGKMASNLVRAKLSD